HPRHGGVQTSIQVHRDDQQHHRGTQGDEGRGAGGIAAGAKGVPRQEGALGLSHRGKHKERGRGKDMKIFIVVLLLGSLAAAGCASSGSTTNPESAQAKCKGTWDSRTNTCMGG